MFRSLKEKIRKKKEEFKEKKGLREVDKLNKAKEKLVEEKEKLKKLEEERRKMEEEPKEEKQEEIKEETKEPKKKGIVSQINEIKETLDIISQKKKSEEKLKKKKFKLPFKVKSQLKKLAMKGKVQVILLQRTRNIKPVIGEIRDGMLLIGEMVYNGAVNSTWLWNGKIPTMLVPEWDLQPMTPEGIDEMKKTSTMSAQELMAYCIKFGRSAVPGKIIIRAIEAKQNLMLKGKANMKTIIITIVVVIIICAVLFGGGI